MKFWEEGQRIKLEQVRWIQSLLVYTDKVYLAIASQDKVLCSHSNARHFFYRLVVHEGSLQSWGTGWRKQRQESSQPRMWDGENLGGRALMRLRDHFRQGHAWMGPYEEQVGTS